MLTQDRATDMMHTLNDGDGAIEVAPGEFKRFNSAAGLASP